MGFIERWNQLVGLFQPTLREIASHPEPAYPGATPFFVAGPNMFAEIARMGDPRDCPVLSVGLVVQPRLLSAESSVHADELPLFQILGLIAPFSASAFREHLVTRSVRGYSLSSQVDQWEAFVGPLAFTFVPTGEGAMTPHQSSLGMIRFFYQVPSHPAVDPRISIAHGS